MKSFVLKSLLVLFISVSYGTSFASELIKVLPMKNATRNVNFDLYIVAGEQQEAVGLKMYDYEDHIWQTYNISNLKSGVAMKKEGSYDVIILRSNDFEKDRGGHFTIDFMKSGITGARDSINIEFEFDGTEWSVYHRGSKVDRLDFHLNTFFGKVVGIKKVTPVLKRR